MRLDLHLDTDPAGTGRRARLWVVLGVLVLLLLLELIVLGAVVAAVADRMPL